MSVNNGPIYTPFFLSPKTNKIIARRRPGSSMPTSTYHLEDNEKKAKTRRPNTANGNGECIYIPAEGMIHAQLTSQLHQSSLHAQQMHHPYFVRRIQTKDMPEGSTIIALQTRSRQQRHRTHLNHHQNQSQQQQQQKCHQQPADQLNHQVIDDQSGLQGVAAEVEVNVEDDPIDSPTSHHEDGGEKSGEHQPTDSKDFDLDRCFDVNELRSRLSAAYHKIGQLEHTNANYHRCKQDNYFLKSELTKSENRSIQLEAVVLEKNMRLKQLLRENIAQSARLKRIQSEFGVDAVKEIFSNEEKL